MASISIRPPRAGDGESLARTWLDAAHFYANLNPELFQVPDSDGLAQWCEEWTVNAVSSDRLLLVAADGGQVVGFISASIQPPVKNAARQFVRDVGLTRLLINALVVRQAYWRQRIGTQLMAAAEDWGRSQGAQIALLDTYIASPVSVTFYENRAGYVRKSLLFRKTLF